MRNEVQVIMFSLSSDDVNPLDILAVNAASAAVTISDTPWNGPVGAVRVGRIDGEFVINPTFEQIDASDLDLRIAGTKDAILMVECGANEVSEEAMVEALELGHQSMQPIIDLQIRCRKKSAKPSEKPNCPTDEELDKKVFDFVSGPMNELLESRSPKMNSMAAWTT